MAKKKLRLEMSTHVIDEIVAASGEVTYGSAAGADFINLDALVYDTYNAVLPSWAASDTELVVLFRRDLLQYENNRGVHVRPRRTVRVPLK